MPKQRTHNEWFFPVARNNRKSCSHCHAKLEPGESIWGWYEYVRAKKRHIRDCCKACFPEVKARLLDHTGDCGCAVELQVCGPRVAWLTLESACDLVQAA